MITDLNKILVATLIAVAILHMVNSVVDYGAAAVLGIPVFLVIVFVLRWIWNWEHPLW